MKIQFNVLEDDEIDFRPIKANSSDIAYDIKANEEVNDNSCFCKNESYVIPANSSAVFTTGVSLNQEPLYKVITTEYLLNELNYLKGQLNNIFVQINDGYIDGLNDFNKISDKLAFHRNIDLPEKMYQEFIPSSEVHSRSGLFFKSNIQAFNGQIDNTYNNEIRVKLTNISDKPQIIKRGERIGQLEIKLVPVVEESYNMVQNKDELNGGQRGGFGSSGKM